MKKVHIIVSHCLARLKYYSQKISPVQYKIMGTMIAIVGFFLIVTYDFHFIGLVLLFLGFFLAMYKGMKPV
jgi:hypothetical protein